MTDIHNDVVNEEENIYRMMPPDNIPLPKIENGEKLFPTFISFQYIVEMEEESLTEIGNIILDIPLIRSENELRFVEETIRSFVSSENEYEEYEVIVVILNWKVL